jgi:RNA-binding protein
MDITSLRSKAHGLKPAVRLGKGGVSVSIVEEIDKQLTKRKLIKIRFLRSFTDLYDVRTVSKEIADKTKSTIIQNLGSVLVLYRG